MKKPGARPGFLGGREAYFLLSGTQVVVLLSYLNPGALLRLSLVAFMTKYILFLSFMVAWTAVNGTATSFSPAPRKPPTPTIKALPCPPGERRTSIRGRILWFAAP